jgi:hypothetical protein
MSDTRSFAHLSSEPDEPVERPQRVVSADQPKTPRPSAADAARRLDLLKTEIAALSARVEVDMDRKLGTVPADPAAVEPEAPRRTGVLSRLFRS